MVLIDLVTAEHGMKKVCVRGEKLQCSGGCVATPPPQRVTVPEKRRSLSGCFSHNRKEMCEQRERFNNKEIRQTFTIKSKSDESISDIGYQTLTHTHTVNSFL